MYNLIAVSNYLKGSDRIRRDNGYSLYLRTFLRHEENLFHYYSNEALAWASQEAVKSPSLAAFKS